MAIDSPSSSGGDIKPGFSGVHDDGPIHGVVMTGNSSGDGSEIKLWLINDRASVDSISRELLDNEVVAASATIGVFSTKPVVSVH